MTINANPTATGPHGSSLAGVALGKPAPAPNGCAPQPPAGQTITRRPNPGEPSRWSLKHTPMRGKS